MKTRIYARHWVVVEPVELEAAGDIPYTPSSSTCVAMETESACEEIVFDICRRTRIRLLHIMLSNRTNDVE